MRYKHPRAEMSPNGIYGGVGSKPAPQNWIPGSARRRPLLTRVPRKLRALRVRRTRRSRMEPTPPYVLWPVVLVAIPFSLMVGGALLFALFSLIRAFL
jgi:hypothetical protein